MVVCRSWTVDPYPFFRLCIPACRPGPRRLSCVAVGAHSMRTVDTVENRGYLLIWEKG